MSIDYALEGHIATININSPEALNAMTDDMHHALAETYRRYMERDAAAWELAETIAANAPLAVRVTKQNAYYARFLPPELASRYVRTNAARVDASEDIKEGAQAFAEKRKPQWQGR